MTRVIRSEFIRIWRPSFRYGGIGLLAAFGALISVFIYTSVDEPSTTTGPIEGGTTVADLAAPGGFLTALDTVAQIGGIVVLALWAIAVATDYDTGLIRVLVQAEPDRLRLLGGKIVALTGFTCLATAVTTLVITMVNRPLAHLYDVPTDDWRTDFFPELLSAYFNFTVSLIVWGAVGLLVAIITRSSGIAIAVGIGYLLVVENLLAIVADDATDYLPGGTLNALAAGGTHDLTWVAALLLTTAYGAVACAAALAHFRTRDIVS